MTDDITKRTHTEYFRIAATSPTLRNGKNGRLFLHLKILIPERNHE